MITFDIPDMTCGHCVAAITRAVQALDPAARLEADIAAHRVRVQATADAAALRQAIAEAGYTSTLAAKEPDVKAR